MSKIKVNEIEKASGSGITVPTGTSFTVTDGLAASTISSGTLAEARIPEIPQSKIADQAINEAKMQISNAPTNGHFLSAQSGNTGGLTWAEAGGGGMATLIKKTSISGSPTLVDFVHGTGGVDFSSTYDSYIILFDSLGCVNDVRMLTCRIFVGGSEYTANYNQAGTGMYSGSGGANQNSARGTYDRNVWNLGNVGCSNASSEQNLSGIMRFYPNGYGAEYPAMQVQLTWWQDNNQSAGNYAQGGVMSAQNANGLRFQWSSDYNSNLNQGGAFVNAGSITLYGVKTS